MSCEFDEPSLKTAFEQVTLMLETTNNLENIMKSRTLAFASAMSLGVLASPPTLAAANDAPVVSDPIDCPISPNVNIGMAFNAKFPDKEGKYYIIPAEVIDAIIKAINTGTILVIDKPPACQPPIE